MKKIKDLSQKIKDRKFGPILGIAIVILLIFAIAIYSLALKIQKQDLPDSTLKLRINSNIAPITNNSDDVQSLKNDLNNSIPLKN